MSAVEPVGARALLVCDYFIRYQTGLAQGLRANGWEPILLGRDHDHAFGGQSGAMRRYIEQRLGAEQRSLRLEGRVRELSRWRAIPRVRRQVRQLAPAVTHVQACISNDPRLVLAADLRPRRYAVTVHDVQTHPGDPPPLRHQLALAFAVVRNAGLVFVHAEPVRDKLLEQAMTRAPVVIIPHGVDDADAQPLPAEPSLLFFGRIRAYKGLAVLLDALTRLWRQRPEATLTIAGEGPLPRHPALEDPRVCLLHRHIDEAEVPGLFAAASLVVLPYVEASQSGVGSLAKGHGRPLVASAVGGLSELLSDGSGVLVPAADADALARTLDDLLGDRARLQRMGEAGLRTLREHAGWPVIGALTIEAYARHLKAPRGLDAILGARPIA